MFLKVCMTEDVGLYVTRYDDGRCDVLYQDKTRCRALHFLTQDDEWIILLIEWGPE